MDWTTIITIMSLVVGPITWLAYNNHKGYSNVFGYLMFATLLGTLCAGIMWPFIMISYALGAMEASYAFKDIGVIGENIAYIRSAVTHFRWSVLIAHCVVVWLLFLRYGFPYFSLTRDREKGS